MFRGQIEARKSEIQNFVWGLITCQVVRKHSRCKFFQLQLMMEQRWVCLIPHFYLHGSPLVVVSGPIRHVKWNCVFCVAWRCNILQSSFLLQSHDRLKGRRVTMISRQITRFALSPRSPLVSSMNSQPDQTVGVASACTSTSTHGRYFYSSWKAQAPPFHITNGSC